MVAKDRRKKSIKEGKEIINKKKAKFVSKYVSKKAKPVRFSKKKVPGLRYGVLHSLFGYSDGVSIVMKQIEGVLVDGLGVSKDNILYLVGKSKTRSKQIFHDEALWHKFKPNQLMLKYFEDAYGGPISERIEKAITLAKMIIEAFIERNKIDILIAHNSSHPENFISSIALSRYYRDAEKNGKKTPKYILWWHDSHVERPRFSKPAPDVKRYLLEGVPGIYVEYILFINSLQFTQAQKYFLDLDKIRPGFYDDMHKNHDIIYNTTDTFIEDYEDLASEKVDETIEKFIRTYKIRDLLKNKRLSLKDALFCLQHTRIVDRKRIDFAMKYCFEVFKEVRKRKLFKLFYFFVSGHSHSGDTTKIRLKRLHKKLCEEYNTSNFMLVFADHSNKTTINFEEYPRIFAKLGGFSTYFSEIEGFGNNLLEVMASGLIPVIYTYPVFCKDIAKYHFKVIALQKFEVDNKDIDTTIELLTSTKKRKIWVNRNLEILRRNFSHRIVSRKLQRAIIRRRTHF